MRKINVADITLKTLSQERDIALLFREKTAIASCADYLKYDAIEVAPIKNLREDTIIYKTTKRDLSYNTENYTQYSVIIYMGKESEKEGIYV